jgi:hypothetical protein
MLFCRRINWRVIQIQFVDYVGLREKSFFSKGIVVSLPNAVLKSGRIRQEYMAVRGNFDAKSQTMAPS